MKKIVKAAYVVVSVAASVLASAADSPAQAPKPGPEQQRLGYYVGTWTTEGEIKPSDMGPGGKITSTDKCAWFEGHFAVVCHSEGTTPMGPMKGLDILGYNTEEKVYTYYGLDNSSWSMTTVPRGTFQGGTWTYTDESVMGGKKTKYRVTIKELSPNSYTFTMESQGADGKWTTLQETKSTKAAK